MIRRKKERKGVNLMAKQTFKEKTKKEKIILITG